MNTNFVEVFAVPGEHNIIDTINPETGLSSIEGETLEQIRARYPKAERMTWESWRQVQITRQQTPITFTRTSKAQYWEMLEVLPPAAWIGGGFLVGEPCDHSHATGAPRFQMYRESHGYYTASSRPVTIAEFRTLMSGGAL